MGKDWYEGCYHSRDWRLSHLYCIHTKEDGFIRFKPNPVQQEFSYSLWYRNIILKARQLGMSTFVAMLMLDSCLFNKNFYAGIIDKSMPDAEEKLAKVKVAYMQMLDPEELNLDHVEDPEDRQNIRLYAQAIAEGIKGTITTQKADFSNGSKIRIGTSLRGGTMQLLHVSEFGHTAAKYPQKAIEILSGGVNTVSQNNVVIMESTHEGGKFGEHYRLLKNAMDKVGTELAPLEDKFFFFAWWQQQEYRVTLTKPLLLCDELKEYFAELAKKGIELDDEQKAWYQIQYFKFGYLVKREYPSCPEEVFEAQVENAIYGRQLDALRAQGRLNAEFEMEQGLPLYISWDIGMSDYMAMWLIQVGADGRFYVLDYYCANDRPLSHYLMQIQEWERKHQQLIARLFLPHDAKRRDWEGTSFEARLQEAKYPVSVVPRTPDLWAGIFSTRDLLKYTTFHKRCSEPVIVEGEEYMSGMHSLENYSKKPILNNGVVKDEPLHNACSHGADALRTFAEARASGMVSRQGDAAPKRKANKTGRAQGVPNHWS